MKNNDTRRVAPYQCDNRRVFVSNLKVFELNFAYFHCKKYNKSNYFRL
nr:MAG TPA: hypothetical protein [Caudoviricetes sp.]